MVQNWHSSIHVISWEVIMSHITKISALTRVVIVLHFYPNVCNRKSNQCASMWHIAKISVMLGGANSHVPHLIYFGDIQQMTRISFSSGLNTEQCHQKLWSKISSLKNRVPNMLLIIGEESEGITITVGLRQNTSLSPNWLHKSICSTVLSHVFSF